VIIDFIDGIQVNSVFIVQRDMY